MEEEYSSRNTSKNKNFSSRNSLYSTTCRRKIWGDSGYKVSGGLHGVGASVVNALSNWTEVTIQRDGGIFQMKFEKGKTVKKLERIGDSKKQEQSKIFADDTIFETLEYEYEVLENRFRKWHF